jgi:hypothetical protein
VRFIYFYVDSDGQLNTASGASHAISSDLSIGEWEEERLFLAKRGAHLERTVAFTEILHCYVW